MRDLLVIEIIDSLNPTTLFTGSKEACLTFLNEETERLEKKGIFLIEETGDWCKDFATKEDGYNRTLAIVSGFAKDIKIL